MSGDLRALERVGIKIDPELRVDLRPEEIEWGIGRIGGPGDGVLVLIRGEAGRVSFGPLDVLLHSHPLLELATRNVPSGGLTIPEFITREQHRLGNVILVLPSAGDLKIVFRQRFRVPEHVLQTPAVLLPNGKVGAPLPGSRLPRVKVKIRNPQFDGTFEGKEVYSADLVYYVGDGNGKPIWEGHMYSYFDPQEGDVASLKSPFEFE